jgi:hypothetical protein
MAEKISPTLFLAFLVATVCGPALSYSKFYLFHLLLAVIFLVKCLDPKKFRAEIISFFTDSTLRALLVFFAIYFLSILWSQNRSQSAQYLIFCSFQISIIFLVFTQIKTQKDLHQAAKVLFWVMTVNTIICTLEWLTPFRYPISIISKYAHYFGKNSANHLQWLKNLEISPTNHTFHTGLHWNFNSSTAFNLMILPFAIFSFKKPFNLIFTPVIAILILNSGFRLGHIVLFLFLLACIVLEFFFGKLKLSKKLRTASSILLLILAIFPLTLPKKYQPAHAFQFKNQLELIFNTVVDMTHRGDLDNPQFSGKPRDYYTVRQIYKPGDSFFIRIKNMIYGVRKIAEMPLLGHGAGFANKKSFLHFYWLENLVDLGLFFGSIIFIWYLWLTYKLYRIRKSSTIAKASFYSLLLYSLCVLAHSNAAYFLPFWLLIAFSVKILDLQQHERVS